MTKFFAALAFGGLGLLAQAAAAQGISTSGYRTTLDHAACVVGKDAAAARALLVTVPGSREEKRAADAIGKLGCEGKISGGALRGAVAEKLYLATFAAPPAEVTGDPAPFQGSGNPALGYHDIARCTASRDPVGADLLIRSDLRSDAEKAALKRILPVLGGCVPAGFKLGIDREKMRGLLAEGLITYRSQPAAPAQAGNQ